MTPINHATAASIANKLVKTSFGPRGKELAERQEALAAEIAASLTDREEEVFAERTSLNVRSDDNKATLALAQPVRVPPAKAKQISLTGLLACKFDAFTEDKNEFFTAQSEALTLCTMAAMTFETIEQLRDGWPEVADQVDAPLVADIDRTATLKAANDSLGL
jgi:hypothetical protein